MPGQSGSETRQRTVVLTTRWTPEEMAHLAGTANYSGCTRAEVLRRLVRRSDKQVITSRLLVTEINRLGNNLNQIARRLNSDATVSDVELKRAYSDLLRITRALQA